MATGLLSYFSGILFLLGEDRSKLPGLFLLFLGVSLLDLLSIGLVGGYVAIITAPNSGGSELIHRWLGILGFSNIGLTEQVGMGLVLLALFALKASVAIMVNRIIINFSHQQNVRLRVRMMDVYQHLPYINYLERNSSEYILGITGYVGNFSSSLSSLLKLASEGLVVLAIFILLAFANWPVLLTLTAAGALLFFGFDSTFKNRLTSAGRRANEGARYAIQGIQEGMSGLKEIRILGRERQALEKVRIGSEQLARENMFVQWIATVPRYMVETLIVFSVVATTVVVLFQGENLEQMYPLIAMYAVAALRVGPVASLMISNASTLRFQRQGIILLQKDLKKYSNNVESSSRYPDISKKTDSFRTLELQGVSFQYPQTNQKALDSISLTLRAGESIGLIGESGSGKTTLVDVILGLLEPSDGTIFYNSQFIEQTLREWRSHVAYLPQDVFLIDASLRCNVALGVSENEINEKKLNRAVEQARLDEMLSQLPNGVETVIGERGVRLSGGQRQRVALARAFYHDREVLVMDEATSALDHDTENEIVSEIQQLKGKKTLIVIAHRLTTVCHCDVIYRLSKGRIVEFGGSQEVLSIDKTGGENIVK